MIISTLIGGVVFTSCSGNLYRTKVDYKKGSLETVSYNNKLESASQDIEEIPLIMVFEEMPMFPGGEIELLKYIQSNIVYPENAKQNGVQGRVFVQFVVTPIGTIGEIRIIRGVDPELDAEAMRVVKSLPTFKPGKQGGVAVPIWYQVPVTFKL